MTNLPVIVVDTEVLDHHPAGWCDTCLKPSALHVTVLASSVAYMSIWNIFQCHDCGARLPVHCDREGCS